MKIGVGMDPKDTYIIKYKNSNNIITLEVNDTCNLHTLKWFANLLAFNMKSCKYSKINDTNYVGVEY